MPPYQQCMLKRLYTHTFSSQCLAIKNMYEIIKLEQTLEHCHAHTHTRMHTDTPSSRHIRALNAVIAFIARVYCPRSLLLVMCVCSVANSTFSRQTQVFRDEDEKWLYLACFPYGTLIAFSFFCRNSIQFSFFFI